ncbi:MAG: hypothetical protein ACK4NE_00870 [Albidovulum sp.]
MTDGPFRNLKLGSGWKRLADAVQNDASSTTECGLLATDGLVRHLATKENCAAVQELQAYSQQPQLDFDPRAKIEETFDAHEKTPFLDTLEKELLYRIADGTPPAEALDRALDAAVKEEVGEARNRFEEECIRLRDTGEMSREACQRAIGKTNDAFDAVNSRDVCAAIREGDKNAFKSATAKREGLDEGPGL